MWSSIQGRFLITAISLAAVLLGFVLYVQHLMHTNTEVSLMTIQDQRLLRNLLDKYEYHLQQTERGFMQHALLPDQSPPQATLSTIARMNAAAENILNQDALQRYPHIRALFIELSEQTTTYERLAREFFATAVDPTLRYPATDIMLNKMQPNNVAVLQQIALAIDEARHEKTKPGHQHGSPELLWRQARYFWAQQVSTFRLYSSNRMGTFGQPNQSMHNNQFDRKIYLEEFNRIISILKDYENKDLLGFEQSNALNNILRHAHDYESGFARIRNIYNGDRWRTDTPFIKEKIRPLLNAILAGKAKIRRHLNDLSNDEVLSNISTGGMLSRFMLLFTGLVYVLLLIGFLAFEKLIRRPMLQMAAAMDTEARGEPVNLKLPFRSLETNTLFEAFLNMRKQIHARQQRLQAVLDNSADGIITIDGNGRIETTNRSAELLFQFSGQELDGRLFETLIKGELADRFSDDTIAFELGVKEIHALGRKKDGTCIPIALKINEFDFQGHCLFIANVADITETNQMIRSLKLMAEQDALTGLFNRNFLMAKLNVILQQYREQVYPYYILYFDLDHFKFVNDTLGHMAGDGVLKQVAALLTENALEGDIVARIGSDEFIVLSRLTENKEPNLDVIGRCFQEKITKFPFEADGTVFHTGCSLGVALLSADVRSAEELLARADIACHIAKRNGRNAVHIYKKQDHINLENMSADLTTSRLIKHAIENDKFKLAAQPIVDIHTMEVRSYEVLLRMVDEDDNVLYPGRFLPSAERYGLLPDVDQWVVNATLLYLAKQNVPMQLAINLSAQSILEPFTLEMITRCIEKTGVDPACLTFEVTETCAIENLNSAGKFLGRLQKLGCQTALDDFGVGYSSFAYLKELPVNYVKIDGSFVKDITFNRISQAMVKSMTEVTHAMGKSTVAEFIENHESLEILRGLGVDLGQGYHLGKPVLLEKLSWNPVRLSPGVS